MVPLYGLWWVEAKLESHVALYTEVTPPQSHEFNTEKYQNVQRVTKTGQITSEVSNRFDCVRMYIIKNI